MPGSWIQLTSIAASVLQHQRLFSVCLFCACLPHKQKGCAILLCVVYVQDSLMKGHAMLLCVYHVQASFMKGHAMRLCGIMCRSSAWRIMLCYLCFLRAGQPHEASCYATLCCLCAALPHEMPCYATLYWFLCRPATYRVMLCYFDVVSCTGKKVGAMLCVVSRACQRHKGSCYATMCAVSCVGQPHEGSCYAAQKDLQMAQHRQEHVKSRLNELDRLRIEHRQQEQQVFTNNAPDRRTASTATQRSLTFNENRTSS